MPESIIFKSIIQAFLWLLSYVTAHSNEVKVSGLCTIHVDLTLPCSLDYASQIWKGNKLFVYEEKLGLCWLWGDLRFYLSSFFHG